MSESMVGFGYCVKALGGESPAAQAATAQRYEALAIARELVWLNHGCPPHALCGADGQMFCSACRIDFQNTSMGDIRRRLSELRIRQVVSPTRMIHDVVDHNAVSPEMPTGTKMTDVKVGMRLRSTVPIEKGGPRKFITVTEITGHGFKYSFDADISLGPRYGVLWALVTEFF